MNQRKKITLFINTLNGGGAERVFINLSDEFIRKGYDVDMVLMKAEGVYVEEINPEINLVDLNASNIFFAVLRMIKYLRVASTDVILSTLIPSNVTVIIARYLSFRKIKLYLREANTLSSQINDRPFFKKMILRPLIKSLYPLADGYIGISKNVAKDLIDFTGVIEAKVTYIYNPCNIYKIEKQISEEVDHPWFKDEIPIVIGVGRLTYQKDFITLIKAFSLVLKVKKARLVLLGQGEDLLKLESLVYKLGLNNSVQLIGYQKNPYSYMAKSNLFVFSSLYEGFGNVLVEALACGIPVISTDCPHGPSEILNNGEFGKLVPVGDPDAMADAMVDVLNRNAIDTEFNKSRAKYFSIEKIADEYAEVLGLK